MKIKDLTYAQRAHLKRAALEGILDTLDKRNRLTTIKGLFHRGLIQSEQGLMARIFMLSPKGERLVGTR